MAIFINNLTFPIFRGPMNLNNPEISIILPCRNEEKAIGRCIKDVQEVLKRNDINGEIIVSDSSADNSPDIARRLGARLAKHDKKGYGIACIEGSRLAEGKYILFADADGTYDFNDIPNMLFYLRKGYDIVIGNRFRGKMQRNAMPLLHKMIGNPLLSFVLRLFFRARIGDSHCGIRAITKDAFERLNMKTTGMEFASEMMMKAVTKKLKIKEIPVNYRRRIGKSKLSSFSDGWRHLRFMLLYAPDYLFIAPGIIFFIFGLLIMALFIRGPIEINGFPFYNHPMMLGGFFTLIGYQIIVLGIYSKVYMKSSGLIRSDRLINALSKIITFESGVVIGLTIFAASFAVGVNVFIKWLTQGFPAITDNVLIFVLITAIIGIQTIFSSFFLSVLLIEKR